MKIKKGQVVRNHNGNDYEVVDVRDNFVGMQDLLLKNDERKELLIARSWYGDSGNETNGYWYGSTRYNYRELSKVKKSFKEEFSGRH